MFDLLWQAIISTETNAFRSAIPALWWLAPIAALIALAFAYYFYRQMMQQDEGNEKMIAIAQAVREGTMAYLTRQYKVVSLVFVVLFLVFLIMSFFNLQNPIVPFAFVTGGFFSGLCGFIGMKAATNASSRTAQAASKSLNKSLQVALRSGAVMGLVVVGFALLYITLWFFFLYYLFPVIFPGNSISQAANPLPQITAVMLSFGMGASTQALFARVGGGIYTKAADVGADLVGKVEKDIPEDDPRNPASIADNVGDNVGDVAGMGADLYESYVGSILASSALGVAAVGLSSEEFLGTISRLEMGLRFVTAPVLISGIGILLSIIAIFMVRAREDADQGELIRALNRSLGFSSLSIAVFSLPLLYFLGLPNWFAIWICTLTGLVVGLVVGKATEYFTSHAYKPTREIARQANTSTATTIIEGLAVGMESGAIPIGSVVAGIITSYYVAGGVGNLLMGLFGVGIASVGMLSTLGFTLSTDAYGPIADNAGGNAQMTGLDEYIRQRTDELDAVGNTTAAIGKGFCIGSAALTTMAMLAAYLEEVRIVMIEMNHTMSLQVGSQVIPVIQMTMENFMDYYRVNLLNPSVLAGLFIGVATAFLFSAMTIRAVGRAAGFMVEEVRRQFREIEGILEGTGRPDYAQCVAISTKAAQREMIAPSLLAIVVPVGVGVIFGIAGVLGLLVGSLAAGFSLAITMANAGGAWDNAKKYIEGGNYGGKGSPAHKASIVGDTVGDPLKDTTGPSLDILIKLMTMVSVVFSGLVLAFGNGQGIIHILLH